MHFWRRRLHNVAIRNCGIPGRTCVTQLRITLQGFVHVCATIASSIIVSQVKVHYGQFDWRNFWTVNQIPLGRVTRVVRPSTARIYWWTSLHISALLYFWKPTLPTTVLAKVAYPLEQFWFLTRCWFSSIFVAEPSHCNSNFMWDHHIGPGNRITVKLYLYPFLFYVDYQRSFWDYFGLHVYVVGHET